VVKQRLKILGLFRKQNIKKFIKIEEKEVKYNLVEECSFKKLKSKHFKIEGF